MANLIQDNRKQPIQAFMEKPDGCTVLSIDSATGNVFQPTVDGKAKTFAIRTTADIRFAIHDGEFVFDSATAPPLWAGEEKLFVLDGNVRDRVTMLAVSTTAAVYITELADD